MALGENADFNDLISNLDALKNKQPEKENGQDAQQPEKDGKENQVVEPKQEISPTLTSNEKTRARNLGTELFTGGMKPLLDIQKQNNEKKKMSNKPKTKGLDMKGFLGKMLGGLGKIFNIPLLITSLIGAIPDIINGVFKFLMKWFLPILIGIILFVEMLKNKETWIKLGNKILDMFKSAWDWIVGPGWDMLKQFFSDLWDWISDPALWEQIGSWIRNMVDQVIERNACCC